MLIRGLVRLSLLVAVAFVAVPAEAQVLYGAAFTGSSGPATLYTIDSGTGAATPVGAIGFERCGGMDANPIGVMYAACQRNGTSVSVLVIINTATGAGTEVGPTGMTSAVADLSFRSDGTLFAYDATNDPEHTVFTIDPGSGVASLVGDTGLSFAGGNAMAFDLAGTLFHSQFSSSLNLNTIDQTSGAASLVGALGGSGDRLASMDVDPFSGVLHAVLVSGGGGSSATLVTVDPVGLSVSPVGATTAGMDAIAFGPPAIPVPAMPLAWLALLALVVTAAGAMLAGRRRPNLA